MHMCFINFFYLKNIVVGMIFTLVTTSLAYQVGATELHDAVHKRDIAAVRKLRDDPRLLLSKDPDLGGETALHSAIRRFCYNPTEQDLDIIEALVQAGILPHFRVEHSPHLSLPKELFAREAGKKTSAFTTVNVLLLERTKYGSPILSYLQYCSVDRSDNELLKKLVKILLNNNTNTAHGRFKLLSQTTMWGENALHESIARRDERMVELLLPYYDSLYFLTQKNADGRNALHEAAASRKKIMLTILLPSYAMLGLLREKDANGRTALDIAWENGRYVETLAVALCYHTALPQAITFGCTVQ